MRKPSRSSRRCAVTVLSMALAMWADAATASPRPLPFTYPYYTLPQGSVELEQYIDVIPTRIARERPDGQLEGVMDQRYALQTEIEYGFTDRLEGAFYLVASQAADAPFKFRGLKQRLRYRLATDDEWPLGVAGYFEIAELHDELELEEKIILGRRFGRLQVLCNLWVEQEYYFQTQESKFIYNPTVGATWEIKPSVIVGLEYWARGRFDRGSDRSASVDAPSGTHHYVGPTILLQGESLWLSLGVYAGLDSIGGGFRTDASYGPLWIRSVLGLDL